MAKAMKATDIISKHQYTAMSRFRMGTVIPIPRREDESDKAYRDRCRLDPSCIGIALTDALPSQYVIIDITPARNMTYHDTSKE